MTDAPLIAARGLRVDVDGAVALEAATFTTRGSSAALLGEASGLLGAIAGTAAIRAGSLEISGRDVGLRRRLGLCGAGGRRLLGLWLRRLRLRRRWRLRLVGQRRSRDDQRRQQERQPAPHSARSGT